MSLGEATISATAAEVFILAEYNVPMLSNPLQSSLYRVRMSRSGGSWVVSDIEVVGVS